MRLGGTNAFRVLLFLILAGSMIAPAPAWTTSMAASPSSLAQLLPDGSWWVLAETYNKTASGSGGHAGSWREDGKSTEKYSVRNQDATSITIALDGLSSWTDEAAGAWVQPNGGATNHGQLPYSGYWTIDKTTLKVTSVCGDCSRSWIGHPAFFIIKPTGPRQGQTVQYGWAEANSDATSSILVDSPFAVGVQSVVANGVSLQAWALTYTGQQLGAWNINGVYSKGPTTSTELFDWIYGLNIGWVDNGHYQFTDSGGAWTETYYSVGHLADTNLTFKNSVPVSVEPSNLPITVDGVIYPGNNTPTALYWDPGTTHTLQVNATYQGPRGVRYVFMNWSDGSNETVRTITASQPLELKALFKTQYELRIVSDFGSPQGAGWYDVGAQATVSINSTPPDSGLLGLLGSKKMFKGWQGDFNGSTPTAMIKMDAPKTIEAVWATDATQAYFLLIGIFAVIIALATLLLKRRTGKHTDHAQPTLSA